VSQAFDSLLSKIENYYSDADYTVQDAEHLSRIAISEYATTQNALVASARHLSVGSVQKIIDLTIDKHITADPSDWMLFAANAVDNVINYAQRGVLASGLGDFTDFLPVGHPSRTNRGAMTASALNDSIARWTAADPRIASDQARYETYKAYSSVPGSVEADYASFKLSALVAAGYVPEDISLPITAAFRMSFAMRSAMSKALAAVRRRHRDGRFAEEFGRLKGFFSRGDGSIFSENGRIVGAERGTNNFEVEFSGSDEIPDGIYSIDAAKTDSVKAVLSERAVKGVKAKRSIAVPTQAERDAAIPLDEFLKTKKDAPEGWTRNEDGSFTSKSGQTLRQVDARPEGDYMFEGVGESGAEDSTKPFLELKDRDGETIGVAQDWAGANKIALTYDAFEEDSKPEEDAPGLDQDAPASDQEDPTAIGKPEDPRAAAIEDLVFNLDSAEATREFEKMERGEDSWLDSEQPAIDVYGPDDKNLNWNAEYDKTTKDLIEKIFSDPAVVEARNDMPLSKTQEGEPEYGDLDNWYREVGAAISWAAEKYGKEAAPGLDQDAPRSLNEPGDFVDFDHIVEGDGDNWEKVASDEFKYVSPDGKLEMTHRIEGDVEDGPRGTDASYVDVKYDGKDIGSFPAYDRDRTNGDMADLLDKFFKAENFKPDSTATDIGPDLERTDSGDLEYYSDTAGADISKVGDKWRLVKSGFEDIEEHPDGVYEYQETKMFDSEQEAIAEAQKWIDLGKSRDYYDFMYNDWFDGQADGLDQDAKNPNWFDDAIDFDDLDNQDNWKDLGGGSREYTSPDGKLKLTFEPDGDSDGEGGLVDASGIVAEYDGQSVGSFRATERDLTSPGEVADALSRTLAEANFNPKDLVKSDDSGEYEFIPASDVGSVSIVKKYDPNSKKLQWEVTKEARDLIDENIEHSYFEQKKFDSLDDARAFAEEFAQILNDDRKFSEFLENDWNDRDYDYGFDQASPSIPNSVKQLADGYNISPRMETVYNSNTKQLEREENSSEFEADGDFYDFGQAVVTLSEYAPGKWVATIFYGDNDGSGQNVLELEQDFNSPEEAFEWTANGFGRQFDNSQVAEGVIERNSSVEMLDFLNSPKFKEIDESYQEEISGRLSSLGFDQDANADEIKASEGGNASYKGSDGSTGAIKSDGSGTWEGSFTDAEGESFTRKFKAEDKAAAWLQKKVDDSKLAAFKKANDGLSPKQLEPATPKQYDLLQELFDERDEIDSLTSDAIKDALDNRNLSKSQISALFGDLQKKPFKPGVDSTKPTDRMLNSLQGYLTTKQISPEELDDILSQLEAGLDRPGIEALTNKLRRKPNNPDAPGLDQDAPTKPLSEKQLEPASDAQYNYLQDLVNSKMDVDADTAAAVADAAINKNLSKAQAGALIGKLRPLADKENAGQFGKPSQKMIDSVNRDVYAKGLSEEDRNEILADLDSLSKGDVSSIISQLKEMPNVPGGLDNYIKKLVEDGDLEALKRLRTDVRNEDSFSVLDRAINSLETGEDAGLDQATPSTQASGPLYDRDEASNLLDEIKAAEDVGEIGNTFLPTDTLKDFDPEDIGDAASMYVELDDAIGNVGEGSLRQKLEQFAEKLFSSIQSRLGPVEAAKRDSDDIGSELDFDRISRKANDLVEFYYPSEGIAFDQLNEPGNNDVGDNRGGGWEARVALDEDEEEETWVASLTSPDGQPNEQRSFDNQEDAARWAAQNLESNNNQLLPEELDEFLSGQIFSTYANNPQALISKLNNIAEWYRGTRRGDGEDVARGILEYVDRLENLLGDSAPKA
jgi:predicted RNA-binding protein Jag